MGSVIEWFGFLGAWCLVAGPLFQAALELRDEKLERERFETITAEKADEFPKRSAWWWLLPPVGYVLEWRRKERYRQAVLSALSPSEQEQLVHFIDKARGWMFVGAGGLLLATQETWDLKERFDWPDWVFVLVGVLMALICAAYTVQRLRRSRS